MQRIWAIILLSALASIHEALPQTKWNRAIRNPQGQVIRERRQFPFGEWIPLSQPCPTCRHFADPLDSGLRGDNIGLTPPRPPTVTRQIHGEGNFFPQDESSILSVPPPPPSAIPRHPIANGNGNFQFSAFGPQFNAPLAGPTQKIVPQGQQIQFFPQSFLPNQPLVVNGNQQILPVLNNQNNFFGQDQKGGKVVAFSNAELKAQEINKRPKQFSNKPQPFSLPQQNQQQNFVQQQTFNGQQVNGQQQVFNGQVSGQQQAFNGQQQAFNAQQQQSINFGSSILTPPPAPSNVSQDIVIPGLEKEEIQLLYVPVETLRQKGTAQEQLLTQHPQNVQFFNRPNGLQQQVNNRPTEQPLVTQTPKAQLITQSGNTQGQSGTTLRITAQPFSTAIPPTTLLFSNSPFQQTPQPFVSATPATPTIQSFVTPGTTFPKYSPFTTSPETTLSHLSTVPNTIQYSQSDIEFGTTPKTIFNQEALGGKSQFSGLKNTAQEAPLQHFIGQQQVIAQQPKPTVFTQVQQTDIPSQNQFSSQINQQQQLALQKQEQERLLQEQRQRDLEEQKFLAQQRKQKELEEQRLLQQQQQQRQKELEQQRYLQKQKELEEQRLLQQQQRQKELEQQRYLQKQKELEEQRLLQQQQRQKELEQQRYLQKQKELEEQRILQQQQQQRQKELEQQRYLQKQKELEEQRFLQEQRQKELENQRRQQLQKQKDLEEKRRLQQIKQKEDEERLRRFQQQQKELEQQRLLQAQQEEEQRQLQLQKLQKQKQENLKKQQQYQLYQQQQKQNAAQPNRHVLPANDNLNFISQLEKESEEENPQLVPHQPPLSVFFKGQNNAEPRITDVLRELRSSNTIIVLDQYFEKMPKVFVGPAGLIPPQGYGKFELPYLSNIENYKNEKRIDKLPFFVAPLNFVPPLGYAKIPFPAPHVGSVVVSSESNPAMKSQPIQQEIQEIPTEQPNIGNEQVVGPELPGLINKLHPITTTPKPTTYVSTPSLPQTTAQLRNRRPNSSVYKPRKPLTRTRPTTTSKPEEEVTQPIQTTEGVRKPFNRFLNRRRQPVKTTTESAPKNQQDGKNLENRFYSVEVYHQGKNQLPRTNQKSDVIQDKQSEEEKQFGGIDRITPSGHGVFEVRPTPDYSRVQQSEEGVESQEHNQENSDYVDVSLQSFEDGPLPTGSAKTITQQLYRPNVISQPEEGYKALSKPYSTASPDKVQSTTYDEVATTRFSESPIVAFRGDKDSEEQASVRTATEKYDSFTETQAPFTTVTEYGDKHTKGFLDSNDQYTAAFAEISKHHHIPGFTDSTKRQPTTSFTDAYPTQEISVDLQAPVSESDSPQDYVSSGERQSGQRFGTTVEDRQPQGYTTSSEVRPTQDYGSFSDERQTQGFGSSSGERQTQSYGGSSGERQTQGYSSSSEDRQAQGYGVSSGERQTQGYTGSSGERQTQGYDSSSEDRQAQGYGGSSGERQTQGYSISSEDRRTQGYVSSTEGGHGFSINVQPTVSYEASLNNKVLPTGSSHDEYLSSVEGISQNSGVSSSQVSPTAPGGTEEQYTTGFSSVSPSDGPTELNRNNADQRIPSFINVYDPSSTVSSPEVSQQYFPSSTPYPSRATETEEVSKYPVRVQNRFYPTSKTSAEVTANPSVQTYTSDVDQTSTKEDGTDADHRLKLPNPSIVRVRTRVRGKSRGQVNFAASQSTTPTTITRTGGENRYRDEYEQEHTTKAEHPRDFYKTSKYSSFRGTKKPVRTTTEPAPTESEHKANVYTIRPQRRPSSPSTVSTKRIRKPTTPLPSVETATEVFGLPTAGSYSQSEHSDISPSGVSNDVYYEQSSLSPVRNKYRKHFGSAEQKNDYVPAYEPTSSPSTAPTYLSSPQEYYREEAEIHRDQVRVLSPQEDSDRYPEWNPSESGFDVSGVVLTTVRTTEHEDEAEFEEPKKYQDGKKAFDPDLEKKTGRRRVRVRVHKRPHENFETAESQNLRTVANVLVPPTTTYKPNDETNIHQLAKNADFSFGGQKHFGFRSREFFRKRANSTEGGNKTEQPEHSQNTTEVRSPVYVRKPETEVEVSTQSTEEGSKITRPKFRGYVRKIVKHGGASKEKENEPTTEEVETKRGNTEFVSRQPFKLNQGSFNRTGRINGTKHKTFVRYVKKNKIRHQDAEAHVESSSQESLEDTSSSSEASTQTPTTRVTSTEAPSTEAQREESSPETELPVSQGTVSTEHLEEHHTEATEEPEVKQTLQPVIQTTQVSEAQESSSAGTEEPTSQPSTQQQNGLHATQRPKFYQTLRPAFPRPSTTGFPRTSTTGLPRTSTSGFSRPSPTGFTRTRAPETYSTTEQTEHESEEQRSGHIRYKYGKTTGFGASAPEKSEENKKVSEQQYKTKNLHTLEVRKYVRTKSREGTFSQFFKNKYLTTEKAEYPSSPNKSSESSESDEHTSEKVELSTTEYKTTQSFGHTDPEDFERETTKIDDISETQPPTTETISSLEQEGEGEEESSEEYENEKREESSEENKEVSSFISETTTQTELPTTIFQTTTSEAPEKITEQTTTTTTRTTTTEDLRNVEIQPDIYRFSKNSFSFDETEKFTGTQNRAHVRNITTAILENTPSFSAPGGEKIPEFHIVTHRVEDELPVVTESRFGHTIKEKTEGTTTESNAAIETTTEYPGATETETSAATEPAVTKAKGAKVLKTSTTTKISHETEICYRGKCIRTKSENPDDDLKLLVDSSSSTMKIQKKRKS